MATSGAAPKAPPEEVDLVDSDDESPTTSAAVGKESAQIDEIKLSSDDSSIEIEKEVAGKPKKPKKRRKIVWQCINPDCVAYKKDDLITADSYVLSSYDKEYKESKKWKICRICDASLKQTRSDLVEKLYRKEALLEGKMPPVRETVLLEDSDEKSETDDSESTDYEVNLTTSESDGDGPNLDEMEKLVRKTNAILKKIDLNDQVSQNCEVIDKRINNLNGGIDEVKKEFLEVEKSLDEIRKIVYQKFEPKYEELDPISINEHGQVFVLKNPNKTQSQLQNKGNYTVTRVANNQLMRRMPPHPAANNTMGRPMPPQQQQRVPQQPQRMLQQPQQVDHSTLPFVPPPGELKRDKITAGMNVYAMRHNVLSVWKLGKVTEVYASATGEEVTRPVLVQFVNFINGKKYTGSKKFSLKEIAYDNHPNAPLLVGTRCIGLYKESSAAAAGAFYSGIIAEMPKITNKMRYLVFFDDGYASYVPHMDIRLVCMASPQVWDDVHPSSREFIQHYIERFPERAMVKLQLNQMVKTELDGKWCITEVMEVDSSLAKLKFLDDDREEWIYRGSTRLGPLYNEMEKQRQRREQAGGEGPGLLHRRQAYRRQNAPIVQYTRAETSYTEPVDADGAPVKKAINVARKSTTKRRQDGQPTSQQQTASPVASAPASEVKNWETEGTRETLNPTRAEGRKFERHQCSPRCLADDKYKFDPIMTRGTNPLLIPIILGWSREVTKTVRKKKRVAYRSPCGRRLRNLEEIHRYLRITQSKLEIDFFNMEWYCKVHDEFKVAREIHKMKDITYGKENMPISGVNSLDRSYPEYLDYSTVRLPKGKVVINTDKEFLVGCNCEDDCQDKDRCACHQLTIQSTASCANGKINPSAGYEFRRLKELVLTGIYECNQTCACSSTCLNRVAQHPLRQKLQVFKTKRRGWGIRTLVDIPHGAFICVYVGNLFDSEEGNKQGCSFGDEYFAELDMIEVVERQKEGYESDCSDVEDNSVAESSGPGERSKLTLIDTRRDIRDVKDMISDEEDLDDGNNSNDDQDFDPDEFQVDRVSPDEDSVYSRGRRKGQGVERMQVDGGCDISSSDESIPDDVDRNWVQKYISNELGVTNEDTKNRILQLVSSVSAANAKSSLINESQNDDLDEAVDSLYLTQVDGGADHTDNDLEVLELKSQKSRRPGGGFSAAANIQAVRKKVEKPETFKSTRKYFGPKEDVFIMDAKSIGNIGRYLNHSCSPNVFVQNVFVDTHDLRFPWVAFFASQIIKAGQELCWDYNYEVGVIPGKELYCSCGAEGCRGRLL